MSEELREMSGTKLPPGYFIRRGEFLAKTRESVDNASTCESLHTLVRWGSAVKGAGFPLEPEPIPNGDDSERVSYVLSLFMTFFERSFESVIC